jgi:hypothetical protein
VEEVILLGLRGCWSGGSGWKSVVGEGSYNKLLGLDLEVGLSNTGYRTWALEWNQIAKYRKTIVFYLLTLWLGRRLIRVLKSFQFFLFKINIIFNIYR